MRSIRAFTFIGFSFAAPLAALSEGARPVLSPAAGSQALLTGVSTSTAQTEKDIELMYAKLAQEAKGKIDTLNDQIRDLARQIQALKEQIKRLEQQLAKIEQDKQKALADLRKQKEKAFADAKSRDAQPVRIPTPTPTPKRP